MTLDTIFTIIAGVILFFLVFSFLTGFAMFNITLKPKSKRNVFNRQHDDIPEAVKEFAAGMKEWMRQNVTDIWSITSFDELVLKAAYIQGTDKHKWAICVHGYTGAGWNMASHARDYLKAGYSVLIPDMRGHGDSEGKYATMGYYDSVDVIEWIYEIIKKDPQAKIALHGVSMGAATVMMTTGEDLPEHVKCAVEDCGYTSLWEVFKQYLKFVFKLPVFPILYTANIISIMFVKMDLKQVSPLDAVKKSNTPTLFIHGDLDTLVPYTMLDELYENAACEKVKLTVAGAAHGEAFEKGGDEYISVLNGFLSKYMN